MHLAFDWPVDLIPPQPGQFFTVLPPSVETKAGIILRRPLAFAAFRDIPQPRAHALYQLRGPGTRALAQQKPGTKVNILGPLGNTFPPLGDNEFAVIVGGGIGLGPLLFLASNSPEALIVLGFRAISLIPFLSTNSRSAKKCDVCR